MNGYNYTVSEFDFTFFAQRVYRIAGLTMGLDELEHGIVRGQWDHRNVQGSEILPDLRRLHDELWVDRRDSAGEPLVDSRIHVGANCASLSCPNLLTEAWRAGVLDTQLDEATRALLANPQKGAGPAGISALFEWFADDFVRDAGSVEAFIEQHREDGTDGVALGQFLSYDWSLNVAP